jgi:hypothetical protein
VPKTFDVELDTEQLLAQEAHLPQGGLFVPATDDAPDVLTEVRVRLRTPAGSAEVDAQVVQVIPGGGVGLMVHSGQAEERIRPLLDRARRGDADPPAADNVALRIQRMSAEEKRELAKYGDRAARMALMKDTNKAVHVYVIQNNQISSDEVRLMAGLRNVNPQVLVKIAENRTWMKDPQLVMALVTNPKTPTNVAIRALDRLPFRDLHRVSRQADTNRQIAAEARRRVDKMRR